MLAPIGKTPPGGGVHQGTGGSRRGLGPPTHSGFFFPLGPLQHRSLFGAQRRSEGKYIAYSPPRGWSVGRLWILDPQTAVKLLTDHDASGGLVKNDNGPKRKGLLTHALTQMSGADWRRQRPAVVKAIGGGLTLQSTRHSSAALQAGELALDILRRSENGTLLDVIEFSQLVAARGIVSAVVGTSDTKQLESARMLEVLVVSYQRASRRRDNLDKNVVSSLENGLRQQVKMIVQHHKLTRGEDEEKKSGEGVGESSMHNGSSATAAVAQNDEAANAVSCAVPETDATALLQRLLARPELSEDEAIGNAFSCLLAGVETTSLLIACSLLHLAAHPNVRLAARRELSHLQEGSAAAKKRSKLVAAVMKETLRVHPPVMGLPRAVNAPEGLVIEMAAGQRAILPYGTSFSVCLLSAAHGGGRPKQQPQPPQPTGCPFATPAGEAAPLEDATTSGELQAAAPDGHLPIFGPPPPSTVRADSQSSGSSSSFAFSTFQKSLRELFGMFVGNNATSVSSSSTPANNDGVYDFRDERVLRSLKSWEWNVNVDEEAVGGGGEQDKGKKEGDDGGSGVNEFVDESAPFGFGPRSCPAGSLSLVVAREVLETLITTFGDWSFADPAQQRRWVTQLMSLPTLVLKGPIRMRFKT